MNARFSSFLACTTFALYLGVIFVVESIASLRLGKTGNNVSSIHKSKSANTPPLGVPSSPYPTAALGEAPSWTKRVATFRPAAQN
jgi:hypothetical protein